MAGRAIRIRRVDRVPRQTTQSVVFVHLRLNGTSARWPGDLCRLVAAVCIVRKRHVVERPIRVSDVRLGPPSLTIPINHPRRRPTINRCHHLCECRSAIGVVRKYSVIGRSIRVRNIDAGPAPLRIIDLNGGRRCAGAGRSLHFRRAPCSI